MKTTFETMLDEMRVKMINTQEAMHDMLQHPATMDDFEKWVADQENCELEIFDNKSFEYVPANRFRN